MRDLKQRAIQRVFDRYMRWRLGDLVKPEYPVLLDYPVRAEPRYGEGKPPHPELAALFARDADAYRATLAEIAAYSPQLATIAETADPARPEEPHWSNWFFSSLDAIALYGLVGSRTPGCYLEVGSGNSTKFARRAVRDLGLGTRIVSIDPKPRADVDALCDEVVRQPLERVDTRLFERLGAGDVLFIDNSHRVFENSDVTVFFLEVLPRLAPGVLVHVHDIFLPYDYPTAWANRHYSEQYLLAAYLLGGASRVRVRLPLVYVTEDAGLGAFVRATWREPPFQRAFAHYRRLTGGYAATSFWMETVDQK